MYMRNGGLTKGYQTNNLHIHGSTALLLQLMNPHRACYSTWTSMCKTNHKQTAMKESWALPRKTQLTSTISWTNTVTAKQRRFIDIAVLRLIGKRLWSHWRHEENSVKITSRAVKLEASHLYPANHLSIQWIHRSMPCPNPNKPQTSQCRALPCREPSDSWGHASSLWKPFPSHLVIVQLWWPHMPTFEN